MEIKDINKKLIPAFFNLAIREAILNVISAVTMFVVLPKILPDPVPIIGIFAIASFIMGFFNYFSDIGLAGALIQKKEVTEDDLKTTFLIQELMAAVIAVIVFITAPFFAQFNHLNTEAMWLIRALGIGFFLASLKVIPTVLLERTLRFTPIVWVDIIEALAFNGVLLYLSFNHFGISAFTFAALSQSIIGVITIYVLAPWNVRVGFSKVSAKSLINFGLPFQLNSVLALLKDQLTPLITARIIGATGVGYVAWAEGVAQRPLKIMSIVLRITFPAFARLQDDHEELRKVVHKALFMSFLLIAPLMFGLAAVSPSFISYLGKAKWGPALPLLYLYIFSALLSVPSTIFTNLLSAIGKIGITLKLMVMWTVLTWLLSPLLALKFGFVGVAWASAIIGLTSLIPIFIVIRTLHVNLFQSIWKPTLAAIIMGVIVYIFAYFYVKDLLTLVIDILLGGVIYAIFMGYFDKEEVLPLIKRIMHGQI